MNKEAAGREAEKPINCWQYMGCGREPGGARAGRLGVCPVSTERRLDGVHGGKNAGRACWVVAGSFAKAALHDATGQKRCGACNFYNAVHSEEGRYTWPATFLQKLLAGKKKWP